MQQNTVAKLSRTASHRKAMLRNMAINLIDHERMITTRAKAKILRPYLEKIITLGKRAEKKSGIERMHLERILYKRIQRKDAVQKIVKTLAQRYRERQGGYLRIIPLQNRKSDNAPVGVIEFVDRTTENRLKNYSRTKMKIAEKSKANLEDGSNDDVGTAKKTSKPLKEFFEKTTIGRITKSKDKKKTTDIKKASEKTKVRLGKKVSRKKVTVQKKKEETPEEISRKKRIELLRTPTKKKKTSKKISKRKTKK